MAHFSIISSQGQHPVIFTGAPRYVGAYLKPGYLEFPEIGSPTAINWHVGDYVVYSRTGRTYRLYGTPKATEQSDANKFGAAFLYENVQFFDDMKQWELCPFTDLVPGDNTVHFSTQGIVSFFGKPSNVAERLQACLENQYGTGSWEVRIVDTSDADLLEILNTEVEFSVSGVNCLQVLDKVYETWNKLGWAYTIENGKNILTIGAPNDRTAANTTESYSYGNGLVAVEKSTANATEIGTRLFAYGSMKNMDATYYRGLDIYQAASVDIEHLMIPISYWGTTSSKPDARKAYIQDASAIAKMGVIPRTAYFDGTGDLPDIHPTIERMTIGEVYDAGGAGYLPDLSKWSRNQRIDEIISANNPSDEGAASDMGVRFKESISGTLDAMTEVGQANDYIEPDIFTTTLTKSGRLVLKFGRNAQTITINSAWDARFNVATLEVSNGGNLEVVPLKIVPVSSTSFTFVLPEQVVIQNAVAGTLRVGLNIFVLDNAPTAQTDTVTIGIDGTTTVEGGVVYMLDKTFSVTIPQIGFDIEKYAELGNGKKISMKTGMCAGRDFEIRELSYQPSTDRWLLTLYRSNDEDLNILFPNVNYPIAAGDQFVLLDIAMPEMYVTVASQRLLEAAQKLLADISEEKPFYAPQINAKTVIDESRILLEGLWMDISFNGAQEYALIDSITIDEGGSNIPTYDVALRQEKGLDWTENIGSASSGKSSVSVSGNESIDPKGTVTSVGLTAPEGMEVEGSPVTGAGILELKLAQGYKIPLISELTQYFDLVSSPSGLIRIKSSYNYLGPRKGLIFGSNSSANANVDLEVVNMNIGGTNKRVLHTKLPIVSDDFMSAFGASATPGASGIDADAMWQLLGASTAEQIAASHLQTAFATLNLGAAATYGVGQVESGNNGLVTGGAVFSYVTGVLSSVLKFQGTTTTAISDGSTTNPITINGASYTAQKGDVVLYDGKEYLWQGSSWEQLGDESSWALKTTRINAGTGLTGGGTLAANRTISLSSASIASLALADTAYQKPSSGIPASDLASAVQTSLGKADTAIQTLYDLVVKNSGGTVQLTYKPGVSATYELTLTKSMVGLGNVENTKLSTWAGSGNITTLGTIGTGTWQGSAIGTGYGGTGFNSYTKGNIIYASATDTLAKLSPNSTATKKYLTMTSSVPSWGNITFGDLPTLYIGDTAVQNVPQTAQNIGGLGILTLANGKAIDFLNKPAEGEEAVAWSVLQLATTNKLFVGFDSSAAGAETYLYGSTIYFRYGTGHNNGLILDSTALTSYRDIIPNSNGTRNLGSASAMWKYTYTNRLYLNANTYFMVDSDGNVRLVVDSSNGKGFYCDGFMSAFGHSSTPGGGGLDPEVMWAYLRNTATDTTYNNAKIHTAHLPSLTANNGLTASYSGTPDNTALTIGVGSGYKLPTTTEWGNKQDKYDFTITGTSGSTYDLANFITSAVTNVAVGGTGHTDELAVTKDGTTSYLTVPYATTAKRFKRYVGTDEAGGYDLNTLLSAGGITSQYNRSDRWANAPTNMTFGGVLQVCPIASNSLAMQFAWDVVHKQTQGVYGTGKLWWRDATYHDNAADWGAWHIIYDNTTLLLNGVAGSDTALTFFAPTSAGTADQVLLSGGAGVAPRWTSSALGSATKNIYLNSSGVLTEGKTYAGGTAVTLNGTSKAESTASFYAPTASGTSGQVLTSEGSGQNPSWVNQATLAAGSATMDHLGNTIATTYLKLSGGTMTGDIKMTNGEYIISESGLSMLGINAAGTTFYCGPGYEISSGFLLSSGNINLVHRKFTAANTYTDYAIWDSSNTYVSNSALTIGSASLGASSTPIGYATQARRPWTIVGTQEAGAFDLNTVLAGGGAIRNVHSSNYWAHAPAGATYFGMAWQLKPSSEENGSMQFFWDGDYYSTTAPTGRLFWRLRNSVGWADDWHRIYDSANANLSTIDWNCKDLNAAGKVNVGAPSSTPAAVNVAGTIWASTGIWSDGYMSAYGLASSSDARLKDNIKDFAYTPELLMSLKPREWDWNGKANIKGHAAGFVAQEVEPHLPYAVTERVYKQLFYNTLHAIEMSGLQDHETRIKALEAENKQLKEEIKRLRAI